MESAQSKNTIYCPVCGGWGVSPLYSANKCDKCNGIGIKIIKSNTENYLRLPGFVDFARRKMIKRNVILYVSMFFILFLGVVTLIAVFFKNG